MNGGFISLLLDAAQEPGLETVPSINLTYETPEDPDLVLNNYSLSIKENVEQLIALLEELGPFPRL